MNPRQFGEDALVEQPALEVLAELGWTVVNAFDETYGPTGTIGRDSMADVYLVHRLSDAVERLNPDVPANVRDEAVEALTKDRSAMERVRANHEVHDLLRDGYRAQWSDERNEPRYATVRYVDFASPADNDWLAASQVWIAGELHKRRPDTILYVNGVPLVLAEFKEPNRSVAEAYDDNLTDYRDTIPDLFVPNAIVLLSNSREALVGSTYAPFKFFGEWATIDADGTKGVVQLDTALRGVCAPERLLDLVENFVAYLERPGGPVKVVARYHQVHGVNGAIDNLHRTRAAGDKRLGVYWHTQGAGKSLSMLWFTQKVLRHVPGKWTFVMVTDRTELDVQLHGEFADAGVIPPEAQVHASSAAHLRELLAADHRYVFTLIHKFRINEPGGETEMPVLTDRDDVIVITDEAHRSQYDTLALNMRQALPNAAFMGFTGTPLMGDEELTRQQFGEYVSEYNFQDAIRDGATVPLYYENRIPELQLVNDDFAAELAALLEEAELDETAESQLASQFGTQYTLLTRPERLAEVAKDLVEHFVGRGFTGKAMYVGLDKAAAVRMYDLVQEAWAEHLAELQAQHDALPELERPWLASRIELMQSTDMAVVVSQGQNEIAQLERVGLDIRPHRKRMNEEDLASRFKDSDDPLRLVFVCAMWMTGFDSPSVSTIYLDRPMRNHSLMQTIARANRVFPGKDNGLIVDYVGVFRNLEAALAIYGAAGRNEDGEKVVTPIQNKEALGAALDEAIAETIEFCASVGVDVTAIRDAKGFANVAMTDAAVEALLVDEDTSTRFLTLASQTRKLFKALLPDPGAATHRLTVAAIRSLAVRITDVVRPPKADITRVADAVDELLDRSVGAEEYVIRAAAEGASPEPLIDLSQIDFKTLAAKFAGRKRSETERLASLLQQRIVTAAGRNPTRYDLVERIETLIRDYNAGSLNIDEYLRRLIELSRTLSDEEQRVVTEGMTEAELAIFDLLTQPEPELTDEQRDVVKASAKQLLEHLHDRLVLDWRRKAETTAAVRVTIRDVLDQGLPEDPYPPDMFDAKVQAVFDHIVSSYADDGSSVYDVREVATAPVMTAMPVGDADIELITESLVERIRGDAEFAALIAEQFGGGGRSMFRTVGELVAADGDPAVEHRATTGWQMHRVESADSEVDPVVATVAAFMNSDGGTLLIGVGSDGELVGLDGEYREVEPANGDGFVSRLTAMLVESLGHVPVSSVRARIEQFRGREICRVDVAPSVHPVWAVTAGERQSFFVRGGGAARNAEIESADAVSAYVAQRWGAGSVG